MAQSGRSALAAGLALGNMLAVGAVCLLASCAVAVAAMDVATYNIKHGQGMDGVVDLNRTAAVINELDVTLVSLQEVDFGVERSGSVQQAAYLSDRLSELSSRPWRHLNAPAIPRGSGVYGNAILYDSDVFHLVDYRVAELPGAPKSDGRRSAGIALFRTACGPLQFVATHFAYRNNLGHKPFTYHEASVMAIESAMAGNIPTLLAGDLNAMRGKVNGNPSVLAFMRARGWDIFSPDAEGTMIKWKGVIDHFAVRPKGALALDDVRVAIGEKTKLASDHYPVRARIAHWGGENGCAPR